MEDEERIEKEKKEREEKDRCDKEERVRIEKQEALARREREDQERRAKEEREQLEKAKAEEEERRRTVLSPRGETDYEKAARIKAVREIAEKEKARERAEREEAARAQVAREQQDQDLLANFDPARDYTPLEIDAIAELVLRGAKIALTTLLRECMHDCTPGNLALEKKTAIALAAKELRKYNTMMRDVPSNPREPSQAQALKNAAAAVEKFISTVVVYVQQNAAPEKREELLQLVKGVHALLMSVPTRL